MIIVSQDKTKTTQRPEFYIQRNSGTDEELQYEIRSIGSGCFGGYKTEERAKEVLKAMTEALSFTQISGTYEEIMAKIEITKMARYEMPEE